MSTQSPSFPTRVLPRARAGEERTIQTWRTRMRATTTPTYQAKWYRTCCQCCARLWLGLWLGRCDNSVDAHATETDRRSNLQTDYWRLNPNGCRTQSNSRRTGLTRRLWGYWDNSHRSNAHLVWNPFEVSKGQGKLAVLKTCLVLSNEGPNASAERACSSFASSDCRNVTAEAVEPPPPLGWGDLPDFIQKMWVEGIVKELGRAAHWAWNPDVWVEFCPQDLQFMLHFPLCSSTPLPRFETMANALLSLCHLPHVLALPASPRPCPDPWPHSYRGRRYRVPHVPSGPLHFWRTRP